MLVSSERHVPTPTVHAVLWGLLVAVQLGAPVVNELSLVPPLKDDAPVPLVHVA